MNFSSISLNDPKVLSTAGAIGLSLLFLGRKWMTGGVNTKTADLTGKIVVITGSNVGIGKETARALAKLGATVVLACRDEGKTKIVVEELRADTKNEKIEFIKLDLNDLSSVREFVKEFKSKYQNLNILINNAGIMMLPERQTTKDGFEKQIGVNHIGHFLLTNLLTDLLIKSAPSRVINLSSLGHNSTDKINFDDLQSTKNYGHINAYGQSKLANILFAREFNKRFESKGVKAVSLHPGVVDTELARYALEKWYYKLAFFVMAPVRWYTIKTPAQGAQTSLYCALCNFDELIGGQYYSDCKPSSNASAVSKNPEVAKKLWEVSEDLVGQKFNF